MNINGLQKMTLLDFPGRVACTVFLSGCDFRCPFCHNSELLDSSADVVMDDSELLSFLDKRRGLLDGVCFTGGEPLLRRELPELIKKIKEKGFAVKVDTNGNHPELLQQIISDGLVDYIAMDIKNCPEKYCSTIGLESFDISNINKSIKMLIESDMEYEFRTTCVKEMHEESDFYKIGEWIKGAKHYFLQSFTDRDTVAYEGLHAPDKSEMERFCSIMSGFLKDVQIRGVD